MNPSQEELRSLALQHTPAVIKTRYGSLNKISRNKARMAKWTYIIAEESQKELFSGNIISPGKAQDLIESQRLYIEKRGKLIEIDGYLGLGEKAVPVQWLYSPEGANIAGMQQILAFPRERAEAGLLPSFKPAFRIVYTPGHSAPGMPGSQAILVDLEHFVTYIMGPDYFGESKKGALRMLNEYMYQRGGLVLHAGAKLVKVGSKTITMTIMGLSGTGKTTTTFSKQGELTHPVQDDMVCLWPGGVCTVTENGCFAKTYGLSPESEPVIYSGTVDPSAWVENVFPDADGSLDFTKGPLTPQEVERLKEVLIETGAVGENVKAYISGKVRLEEVVNELGIPNDGWDFVVWTQNGRSIIPLSAIKDAANLDGIPPVASMGILNRDEGKEAATPGIVRFTSPEQAAGYFMLGETTKTSAAGKETGKTRSPFTQPFFPRAFGLQARRFKELASTIPHLDMWMMNTGYVGGDQRDLKEGKALKVKISHSSSMLEAMLSGRVIWKRDPDFGYEIVDVNASGNTWVLERVPAEILSPELFYKERGRVEEYRAWVSKMKRERGEFLKKYQVEEAIVKAVTL